MATEKHLIFKDKPTESSTTLDGPRLSEPSAVKGTSTVNNPLQAKPQSVPARNNDQYIRQYITRSKYELITKPSGSNVDLELPTYSSEGTIKDFLRNLNLFPSRRQSISKIVSKTVSNQVKSNQAKTSLLHQAMTSNPKDLGTPNIVHPSRLPSDVNCPAHVINLPHAIDVDDIKVISDAVVTHESELAEGTHTSEFVGVTHESKLIGVTCESELTAVTCESKCVEVTHESKLAGVTCESELAEVSHESKCAEVTHESDLAEVTHGSDRPEMPSTTVDDCVMLESEEQYQYDLNPVKYNLIHNYTKSPVVFNFPSPKPNMRNEQTKSKLLKSLLPATTKQSCEMLSPKPNKSNYKSLLPATMPQSGEMLSSKPNKSNYKSLLPATTEQSGEMLSSKPNKSNYKSLLPAITKQSCEKFRTLPPKDNSNATVTCENIQGEARHETLPTSTEAEVHMTSTSICTPITPLGKLLITQKSKVKADAFPGIQEVITASKTPGSVLYSILAQLKERAKEDETPDMEIESPEATEDLQKHQGTNHHPIDQTLSPVKVEVIRCVPMNSYQIGNHSTDLDVPPSPIKEEVVSSLDTSDHFFNPGDVVTVVKIKTAPKKSQDVDPDSCGIGKQVSDHISAMVKLETDNLTANAKIVDPSTDVSMENDSADVDEPASSADTTDTSIETDQMESPLQPTNIEGKIKLETDEDCGNNLWSSLHIHPTKISKPSSASQDEEQGKNLPCSTQSLIIPELPSMTDKVDNSHRNLFSVFNLSPKKSQKANRQNAQTESDRNASGTFANDTSVMDSKDDSDQDSLDEDQVEGSPEEIKAAFQTLISEVETLGPRVLINAKSTFRIPDEGDQNSTNGFTYIKAIQEPMLCPICNRPFKFASHILEHVKIHFDAKPYKCHYCPKRFRRKHGGLKKHMLTHTAEKTLSCGICHKTFTQSAYLVQHMSCHTDLKPFKCELCGKDFKKKCHVQAHMSCQHSNEKPFVCSICGKRYKLNSHLVQHIKTHSDEKAYSCAHCSKSFHAALSLKRHMKLHTGEKPFECEDCGKAFIERGNWVRHMKRVCKRENEDRKFKCDFCDKRFLQRIHQKVHMRIHTDEIPFWCRLCGKGFKTAGNRKSHYTWHVKKGDIDTVEVLEETDALIEAQNRILKATNTGMHLPTHPRVCDIMSSTNKRDHVDDDDIKSEDS